MTDNNQRPERATPQYPYPDDEISLVDLWLVLMRRKWWIIGIAAACVAAGTAYAFTQEPEYRYTTTVELARLGDADPIVAPESARALLGETLVPMVRSGMREGLDPDSRPPRASVHVPEGGADLVQINSEGPRERQEAIQTLHAQLVEQLKENHDHRVSLEREDVERRRETAHNEYEEYLDRTRIERQSLEADVEDVRREMERLAEQRKHLTAQLQRIEAERERIEGQIKEAEGRMAMARTRQALAPDEVTDEARAMTLLMLQSQIEDADRRIANLKERLHVKIPDREDELELALADNTREVAAQESRLAELEARLEKLEADRQRRRARLEQQLAEIDNRLERMRTTEARVLALPSVEPVGGGKQLTMALSLVLGLMLGVFGAFFRQFLSSVRAAQESQ